MPPVDPRSYKPKFIQIADHLRDQIRTGAYRPDTYLPSEADLAHIYEVSSLTARRALGVLETERLIVREQGIRARVRPTRERNVVTVEPGDRITVRAATADERRQLGLGEHEPVAEIVRQAGGVQVVAAYDVEFRVDGGDG
jgi:DNA-binding GntR family transcriptional regulator